MATGEPAWDTMHEDVEVFDTTLWTAVPIADTQTSGAGFGGLGNRVV